MLHVIVTWLRGSSKLVEIEAGLVAGRAPRWILDSQNDKLLPPRPSQGSSAGDKTSVLCCFGQFGASGTSLSQVISGIYLLLFVCLIKQFNPIQSGVFI